MRVLGITSAGDAAFDAGDSSVNGESSTGYPATDADDFASDVK